MSAEARLAELGLDVPDFIREGYYGASYGSMKPFHITGKLLFLSGHVPQRGSTVIFPGRLGGDLTVEQGREAARLTGLNVIAGIKQAVGDLHRVRSIVRSLNFVVCTPDFTQVPKVSSGLSDLLAEVFGRERGIGGRAAGGGGGPAAGNWFRGGGEGGVG